MEDKTEEQLTVEKLTEVKLAEVKIAEENVAEEQVIEENKTVRSELTFSGKCFELLDKYRNFLVDFKNRCVCEQNKDNETNFIDLEEQFKCLADNRDEMLAKNPHALSVVKSEAMDVDSNDDMNLDSINESEEEFAPKRIRRVVRRKRGRPPKNAITVGKGTKKRKKYVYYNFKCDWVGCDRQYSKKDDLLAHVSSVHTKEKPFECDICSKSFAIEKFLKNHLKVIHNKIEPKIKFSEDKIYFCDIEGCGKSFSQKGALNKHKTVTHSNEKPYVCEWPGCSAAYKIKESLVNHKAIHSDERQFKCDVEGCTKTFQTKWNFYSHMKTHRDQDPTRRVRRYPCDWPGCQFNGKNKQDLTIHMNRHMNIKPYKCEHEDCPMSYFTSYELKQHVIKVHEVPNENDREFKCHYETCSKKYATERDLKRHLRRHDRIYVCSWPECGQRYAAKQLLSDHMDRHLNVKSFHCHYVGCGKSFFSKTNYESHMKKMHKDREPKGLEEGSRSPGQTATRTHDADHSNHSNH